MSLARFCSFHWVGGGKVDLYLFPNLFTSKQPGIVLAIGKEGSFAQRIVETKGMELELIVPSCNK